VTESWQGFIGIFINFSNFLVLCYNYDHCCLPAYAGQTIRLLKERVHMLQTLAVIPARFGSTRLPGKPLIKLKGKELILWVLDGVRQSRLVDRIIVATDHHDIANLVTGVGGEAMLTPEYLATGGDRVAFVAQRIASQYVINAQGDDPLINAQMIDPMIAALRADANIKLALLARQIEEAGEISRDSVVKMVFDRNGYALYFSRSPIPFARNPGAVYYKHIGPYAWRRQALLEFSSCPQGELEKSESLEMLRVLEKGDRIKCIITGQDSIEIDTPADVERFHRCGWIKK
jgi:3-deoxy-manno-octulosonate cytidylyltransferase (CMP-KDO synthetase)